MKTYLITAKAYMKDYYNGDFWIDENIVGSIRLEAGSTGDAFDLFIDKTQEVGIIDISKNALKNKRPVYNDLMGNVQTGWCVTASTILENGYSRAKSKYIDLWIDIEEISIPEF